MRPGRPAVALLALSLLMVLVPVASEADSADGAELQERLDEATQRLDEVESDIARNEEERDELAERVSAREEELEEIAERVGERVRQVYKHGTSVDPFAVFLASDEREVALERAETVSRLVHGDRAETEEIVAERTSLAADIDQLEERVEQLEASRAEQRELTDGLEQDFARAKELQEQQEAEAAAEEEAEEPEDPVGVGPDGMACPVDQPRSFTDTWGAARSGGRSHEGTDIMAPMGTPIRAITDGEWDIQSPGASAGNWAILRADNGDQYWYMHLESHTVGDGARVSAGDQTGTNGDTGNARGIPHLHFEQHPGGGAPINPYPLLRGVCG